MTLMACVKEPLSSSWWSKMKLHLIFLFQTNKRRKISDQDIDKKMEEMGFDEVTMSSTVFWTV